MPEVSTIQGGIAKDHRGSIRFVNDFDMSEVKRFYIIENADTEIIRGWRAHRIEQRWFYVLDGAFLLRLVKIDDWEGPSADLPIQKMELRSDSQQLIHVPPGYGTAFQALERDSRLLVYADYGIEHAPNDDYTYPFGYFVG